MWLSVVIFGILARILFIVECTVLNVLVIAETSFAISRINFDSSVCLLDMCITSHCKLFINTNISGGAMLVYVESVSCSVTEVSSRLALVNTSVMSLLRSPCTKAFNT